MGHSKEERLYIAWCDDGMVDGYFMEGVVDTLIKAPEFSLPIKGFARSQGINIASQRQTIMNAWKNSTIEWMLWLDSDVVVTPELIKSLWDSADANERPIVSGVYFTLWVPEGTSVPVPVPAVFLTTENGNGVPVHPIPEQGFIEADYTGLGLVIMHRSIFTELDKVCNEIYFDETLKKNGKGMGEDASFFKKVKEANIPFVVNTAIKAKHMKRFSVDVQYYNFYWNNRVTL